MGVFLIDKTLHLFQTSRAAQNYLLANPQKLLYVSSFAEFFEKAIYYPNRVGLSKTAKKAVLKKVIWQLDLSAFGFEKNFLDFLSHGDFLLSFFEELSSEEKMIDDIRFVDVYAAFEEHLSLLEKVFLEYKKELDNLSAYDSSIFFDWELNRGYLSNFERIEILFSGYLSNFELSVLARVSEVVETKAEFLIDSYNKKMRDKLLARGFEIDGEFGLFELSFSEKKCKKIGLPVQKTSVVKAYRFKSRIYQAPFALSKVADFLDAGYAPEKIAIVLMDDSFASSLQLFDKFRNLNYAFGRSVVDNKLFIDLKDAIFGEKDGEPKPKVFQKHENLSFLRQTMLSSYGVDSFKNFLECFLAFEEFLDDSFADIKELCLNQIFWMQKESFAYSELLSIHVAHLFLEQLSKERISDKFGGAIKVIGALEARGAELDAVLIVDMSDEFFPKRVDKDLFLNSSVKEKAGIPTAADRQNLQKHFLADVMRRVKECHFCFVENDESSISPFLLELEVEVCDVDDSAIFDAFVKPKKNKFVSHNFFDDSLNLYEAYKAKRGEDAVGVSAFCDFLKCDRLFWFKHILLLKREEIVKKDDIQLSLGLAFHNALKNLFQNERPKSAEEMLKFLESEALKYDPNLSDRFEFLYALKQLERFCQAELSRAKEPLFLEKDIRASLFSVEFNGRVDRIDEGDEGALLIDYKFVNFALKADTKNGYITSHLYQLALYAAMLDILGTPIAEAYYYDVYRAALVKEEMLSEKVALLESHIERFLQKPQFLGAKKPSHCSYCDFSVVCQK